MQHLLQSGGILCICKFTFTMCLLPLEGNLLAEMGQCLLMQSQENGLLYKQELYKLIDRVQAKIGHNKNTAV